MTQKPTKYAYREKGCHFSSLLVYFIEILILADNTHNAFRTIPTMHSWAFPVLSQVHITFAVKFALCQRLDRTIDIVRIKLLHVKGHTAPIVDRGIIVQ